MEYITMDGIQYRVRTVYRSREEAFELISGRNTGKSLNSREIRDLQGTAYSYMLSVEPDPQYWADYNAFWSAISAPVDTHSITMPSGDSTITFDAMILSGKHTDMGVTAGHRRYSGLTVQFIPIEPQRRPT